MSTFLSGPCHWPSSFIWIHEFLSLLLRGASSTVCVTAKIGPCSGAGAVTSACVPLVQVWIPRVAPHTRKKEINRERSALATSSILFRPSADADLLPRGYNSHHILVSAVLNYVDSADYLISCKAMNCLQARLFQYA